MDLLVLEIFSSLDDFIIMLDDEKKGLYSMAHGLLRGVCFTAVPPSEAVFWEGVTCTSNFLPLEMELRPQISILNLRCISVWLFPHTHISSVGHTEFTFCFSALHASLLLSITPVFDSSSCSCWRCSLGCCAWLPVFLAGFGTTEQAGK